MVDRSSQRHDLQRERFRRNAEYKSDFTIILITVSKESSIVHPDGGGSDGRRR